MHTWIVGALVALAVGAQGASWPDISKPAVRNGAGAKDAAVVVAIEDYAYAPHVKGARSNGRDWHTWLTVGRGVPADRTHLVLDGDAALEEMRHELSSAAAQVEEGGILWFVFIGHGAPSTSKDGLLVGADARQTASSIEARSLTRTEALTLMGGGKHHRSVAVIDACFSGKASSDSMLAEGLQPLISVDRLAQVSATVLMAGRHDQYAGPLAGPIPGSNRPAFSYLVLGALRGWGDQDGDGKVTAEETRSWATSGLDATMVGRAQTPELSGNGAEILSSEARESPPDLAAIRRAITDGPRDGGLVIFVPLDVLQAQMDEPTRLALEEVVRSVSADAVAGLKYAVASDPSLDSKLPCDGACAQEAAKRSKAKYFMTGSVAKSEGDYVANLRLFETAGGRQLGALSFEGSTVKDLRRTFQATSSRLFERMIAEEKAAGEMPLVQKLSWAAVGTGAAALVAGSVLGWKSRSLIAGNQVSEVDGIKRNSVSETRVEDARTWAIGANVLFGVAAAAGIGGGLGLILTAGPTDEGGGAGVTVNGRF
jgi:hypothetical protein